MDDTEWKEKLTPEQYRILRKAGTERPFGEVYSTFKKQGLGKYVCAGCDTELFSSKEKFDSKCGWPSFYDPSKAKNVKTSVDYHLGYPRTEVLCAVCDGHLGHVFTGEGFDTPTDKRYCINGTVLKFIPAESADSEEKPKKPVFPRKIISIESIKKPFSFLPVARVRQIFLEVRDFLLSLFSSVRLSGKVFISVSLG